MEMKLKAAAEKLPEPKLDYGEIAAACERKAPTGRKTVFRAAIAAVIVISLAITGYAYGTRQFGLWSGLHSRGYGDVVLLSWRYDYEFPENLGGIPFYGVSTYYAAPNGTTHLEALLKPTYEMCTISYCIERQEDRCETNETSQTWTTELWTEKNISVSFGTTKNENWKYHFSVAEDGSCNYEAVLPDSQYSLEYEGYVLHFYSVGEFASIRWEDTEKQMVLDVSCKTGELDVLEIAKELIDLNR